MFANTLIFLFIIAMSCWWGLAQSFFSAFLQLMATVLAAALAVALWEPVVFGIIIDTFPKHAWGVGLLGPFVLWLVVLRTASRALVPGDIELGRVVNVLGGAACGLLSAVLASGVTVLGVGFLPLPPNAGGYRPLVIQEKWRIAENPDGQLWLPVERYAQSFLSMLSGGVFDAGTPLAHFQPDLVRQASLLNMRYSPDSTTVAAPGSVRVTGAYGWPMPVEGLDVSITGHRNDPLMGRQLVVIDTVWQINRRTRDSDGALRVPPTQVSLVTIDPDRSSQPAQLYEPVGWVQTDAHSNERVYTSFDSSAKPVFEHEPPGERLLGWVFTVPVEAKVRFILTRRLRHTLPKLDSNPRVPVAVLGRPRGNPSPANGQDR